MIRSCLFAALSGAACAAAAQSSVTAYGVIDAALSYGHGSLSSLSSLTSGGNMTSRWGLRGIEDLGGGLKAGFVLESQIFVDTGAGQPTNTNNQPSGVTTGQGSTFARRSTISLMGAWGELRFGRDFTAHYRNRVEVDPFGNAGVGAIQPFTGSIAGVTSTRASNMLAYFLPSNLGGIYGQVQLYRGENASDAPNAQDGNGASIRLGYADGPLNISLAYGRTQYARTATLGDITTQNIGAQYDFGLLRLMGGLYRDRVDRNAPLTAKGWTLGTLIPVGANEVKLALSSYGTDAGSEPTTRKLSLGYVHNLSKRTALYATGARVFNSGGASTALNTSTTAANAGSSGFDFGIRHLF